MYINILKKNNNRKTFSLIKLSIVLIIIGLLVVEIIGSQNFIKNPKFRTVITEIRDYEQDLFK